MSKLEPPIYIATCPFKYKVSGQENYMYDVSCSEVFVVRSSLFRGVCYNRFYCSSNNMINEHKPE